MSKMDKKGRSRGIAVVIALVSGGLVAGSTGCELIANFDRTLIDAGGSPISDGSVPQDQTSPPVDARADQSAPPGDSAADAPVDSTTPPVDSGSDAGDGGAPIDSGSDARDGGGDAHDGAVGTDASDGGAGDTDASDAAAGPDDAGDMDAGDGGGAGDAGNPDAADATAMTDASGGGPDASDAALACNTTTNDSTVLATSTRVATASPIGANNGTPVAGHYWVDSLVTYTGVGGATAPAPSFYGSADIAFDGTGAAIVRLATDEDDGDGGKGARSERSWTVDVQVAPSPVRDTCPVDPTFTFGAFTVSGNAVTLDLEQASGNGLRFQMTKQ